MNNTCQLHTGADDLGVKWKNSEDFKHLRDCLNLKYEMKADVDSKQHVGMDLEWDHANRTSDRFADDHAETCAAARV